MTRKHIAFLFVALLPLAVQAGASPPSSVRAEVARDLDEARQEVRTELARERTKLDTENLSLGDSLRFGKDRPKKAAKSKVPPGEITPKGNLLIAGKAVAIDAQQRRQLLAYRAQIISLARIGIDAGEQAAMLAIEATDVSLFRLIVGGLSGSLERRVDATVKQQIQPMVLQICRRLPQVLDSQQALAASLPEFRPYATLERDDIDDCERDIRNDLAAR